MTLSDADLRQQAFSIRPSKAEDDPHIARIIRQVMPEFGASGPGYAISDPEVDEMTRAYATVRSAYYVVIRDGLVLGGGGFAPLVGGGSDVCELRKMYFLPEARGHGLGRKLLLHILEAARSRGFEACYLETLDRMQEARALYASLGFVPLAAPLGATGHFSCNSWMLLKL